MATQPDTQPEGPDIEPTPGAEPEATPQQPDTQPEDPAPGEPSAPDPIADLAKSMGWRPKEEFKGDPNLWKPADEYIRAGADIQRGQSRELKELKHTMETVARTNAQIVQSTIAAEREKLVRMYNQAVEDGDPQAAFKLSADIQTLNGRAQQLQMPQQLPPPPEAQDWVARNQWFSSDPLARDLALSVAERYAQAGKSNAEQLAAAEREVKRAYPHLFPVEQGKPPPGVKTPSGRGGDSRRQGSTYADLPVEAKKIADDMANRGVIPDREAYAKQYWQNAGKRA